MIVVEVEVYNFLRERYDPVEALINTGASVCVIARHNVERLGIPINGKKVHLWQVRDPLALEEVSLKLRYRNKPYNVKAVGVDIPMEFRRSIREGEECTRPRHRNPLSKRIILGMNFISELPEQEQQQIMEVR